LSDIKRISPLIGAFLFLLVISVAGYFAINDLAGSQSQQQQQSVSPIFGLIESELVEPLHIAKTLDKIGVYKDYFSQDVPDQKALIGQLQYYSALFNLEFYVAHDKSRKQYNSDGRVFDLIEGKVIWYFALKNEFDSEIQAVLGKREDVHLYIDVRQYDSEGEFIGFIGIGKSLNDFIASFEKYKSDYGHEFLFVNNRGEIVLASRTDLLPTRSADATSSIGITDIADLDWYDAFLEETQGQVEPSLVVNSAEGDLLVSKLTIETLNWSLYLLTPLSARQKEVNQSFAIYIGLGMLLLLFLYKVVYSLFDYFSNKMSRRLNYDPLTKLANRHYAQLFFTRNRRDHRQMSLLFIDLDHFTQLNENFGQHAGDELLTAVANSLVDSIKFQALAVRWSGQQFVIILPDIEQDEAVEIAQKCRLAIEENKITVSSSFISTTASIGISHSRDLSDGLGVMVDWAEQAMREAKQAGRNQSRVR
jgi:diguanylate cyclase (GGDEF)-like protein